MLELKAARPQKILTGLVQAWALAGVCAFSQLDDRTVEACVQTSNAAD